MECTEHPLLFLCSVAHEMLINEIFNLLNFLEVHHFLKFLQGQVLKGWIYVTSDKQHSVKKSIKYLEEGIQDNTDIFGMMGKVGYGFVSSNYRDVLV